jgi:regulator of protease activity HflC (stomatin/prohibitin superfamily)
MKKQKGNVLIGAVGGLAVASIITVGGIWLCLMHTEVVEPGHQLVVNDKPYFFGHNGVRDEPITEGRKLLWISSSAQAVKMTPQSITVKVDDFGTMDGTLVDFETTFQFRVKDSVALVKNFGEGWFENNIRQQYLAIIREALKKRSLPDLMSNAVEGAKVDSEVTTAIQDLVKNFNIPIEVMNITLGRAMPNQSVRDQIDRTATERETQKTLIEARKAQVERKAEQEARADADNAYRNKLGLSPEQFIQLESIRSYSAACAKSPNCIVTSGQANVLITK